MKTYSSRTQKLNQDFVKGHNKSSLRRHVKLKEVQFLDSTFVSN